MLVLGIDPGYAIVGYGAIEFTGTKYRCLGYGAITTSADTDFNERLEYIFNAMNSLIKKCHPNALSIEKLYFQNNQKTAINVAQARGVIILSAQLNKVPVFEYTPLQVKTAVTGYGQAKKNQVMAMTRKLLNLEETPKPDDAADALAIAMCHTQAKGFELTKFLINKKIILP